MIRRFMSEHLYLAYIISFILLVVIPLLIYKLVSAADTSLAMQSNPNTVCIETNAPVYQTTYYRDDNTTYRTYSPSAQTSYRYNYSSSYDDRSIRPHGPPAWDTGSYRYYDDYSNSYNSYSIRPHGQPAW